MGGLLWRRRLFASRTSNAGAWPAITRTRIPGQQRHSGGDESASLVLVAVLAQAWRSGDLNSAVSYRRSCQPGRLIDQQASSSLICNSQRPWRVSGNVPRTRLRIQVRKKSGYEVCPWTGSLRKPFRLPVRNSTGSVLLHRGGRKAGANRSRRS